MAKYNQHEDFPFVAILEHERKRFQMQIIKYCNNIAWKENSDAQSLDDLLTDAKNGKDGGFNSISRFFDSACYNDWIILAQITTLLHNRDHSGAIVCIIRMAD